MSKTYRVTAVDDDGTITATPIDSQPLYQRMMHRITESDTPGKRYLNTRFFTIDNASPGQVIFVTLSAIDNDLDDLARDAIEQYERGETTSLRDFAAERGIDLDAKDDDA